MDNRRGRNMAREVIEIMYNGDCNHIVYCNTTGKIVSPFFMELSSTAEIFAKLYDTDDEFLHKLNAGKINDEVDLLAYVCEVI